MVLMARSGTIVRYAVAFATLLGRPLHIVNVRSRRSPPGLRAQHLASVLACAELSRARVEGAHVGAKEFTFVPGGPPRGGSFQWKIGTAGSTTMLAFSVLPVAAWADAPLQARITGGLFQDHAPSPFHMAEVLQPLLRRMGLDFELRIHRPGYFPQGGGEIELHVRPTLERLKPLVLDDPGQVSRVHGLALASHLTGRQVCARMSDVCSRQLEAKGFACNIERQEDTKARQRGASLAVWATSTTGCIYGADMAGVRGRRSENIGRDVAQAFIEDLASGSTVDRHAADMLILFAALADGETRYTVPQSTEHVETNLWLVRRVGAQALLRQRMIRVTGIGFAGVGRSEGST
jgi:RNA 3'-terminal phosphate cyclase (ATP)